MIVFLDANIIIYQVEAVPDFRSKLQNTLNNLVLQHPGCRFAVSRLSLLECLVKPLREGNQALCDRYRLFFASSDLVVIEISVEVIETALQLRAATGLRTPDAIQAASALVLSQNSIFVTGDKRFASINKLTTVIVQ
jgi:predicted nucleic acid-binding protein